ncbi:MAG: DUF1152 domain-containing protein [Archaeoglobaceae archaeon]
MEFIRILKDCKRKKALVFGMGGGGDIVSTIPIANFLKLFDFHTLHGSVLWDRVIIDPKPGPRSVEELVGAEKICDTIAFITEETKTSDGIRPNLARAAKYLGKVIGLDITKGVRKLGEDLLSFSENQGIELLIGVDAGGDSISVGYESGVRSPLADAISVAILSELDGIVAVTGFGSDGELKFEELLLNISELYKLGSFLGCSALSEKDCRLMSEICEEVVTEASRIPVMAYRGEFGLKKIRKGRTVLITPLSALVFYFKARGVFEINECAKLVKDASSIGEANRILNKNGVITELDYEKAVSI